MSYNQPPSRNAYGDQDFIKEDYGSPMQPFASTQSSVGPPQSQYLRPNSAYSPTVPYSTPAPPEPVRYNIQQSPLANQQLHQQTQQQPTAESFRDLLTLTPEDQLFMKTWRRDCFIYRTLPMTLAGSGALFYYNQSKSLAHKPSRYLLVAIGAYIVGRYTYTGELKRRLESNPSSTPFMKKMRELLGVRASFAELDSSLAQDYSGFAATNDLSQPLNPSSNKQFSGSQTSLYGQTLNHHPHESDISLTPEITDGTTKTMTSYEELRARNRGLIQK